MLRRMTTGFGSGSSIFVIAAFTVAVVVSHISVSASAAEPVALIVEINGEAKPSLSAFSEVSDGAELVLEPGSRVTFLHYQRCEEVTVESGLLTMRAGTYRIVGGDIVRRTARGCPKTSKASSSKEIGGVLFRGDNVLQLSPSATLIIIGPGSGDIAQARIEGRSGRVSGNVAVSRGVIDMKAFPSWVQAGEEYQLELLRRSGAPALRIAIVAASIHNDLAVIRAE